MREHAIHTTLLISCKRFLSYSPAPVLSPNLPVAALSQDLTRRERCARSAGDHVDTWTVATQLVCAAAPLSLGTSFILFLDGRTLLLVPSFRALAQLCPFPLQGAASAGQLVASHDRHVFAVDGDCLYFSSTLAGANAPPAVVSVALPSQPQQVLISRTGSYLAVVGRKGVAVVLVGDAPKWNPTSASAIKAVNFMLPIPSWADVASASWHQMSESDSHIGVLLANRKAGTSAIKCVHLLRVSYSFAIHFPTLSLFF